MEKQFNERTGVHFYLPSKHGSDKVIFSRSRFSVSYIHCPRDIPFNVPYNRSKQVLKGQLFVEQFHEKVQFSFLDYISSGFELNFMVAVDFTGIFLTLKQYNYQLLINPLIKEVL